MVIAGVVERGFSDADTPSSAAGRVLLVLELVSLQSAVPGHGLAKRKPAVEFLCCILSDDVTTSSV